MEQENLHKRLKPTMLVCRGHPLNTLPELWRILFPSARYFVFSDDSRYHRLMDFKKDLPDSGDGYDKALEEYAGIFDAVTTAYSEVKVPGDWNYQKTRLTIRYRMHRAYRQLLPDEPGQRYHVLRGSTRRGDVLEASFWLHETEDRELDALVEECVSVITWDMRKDISPSSHYHRGL